MDWAKTNTIRDKKRLSFGIWSVIYQRFDNHCEQDKSTHHREYEMCIVEKIDITRAHSYQYWRGSVCIIMSYIMLSYHGVRYASYIIYQCLYMIDGVHQYRKCRKIINFMLNKENYWNLNPCNLTHLPQLGKMLNESLRTTFMACLVLTPSWTPCYI